MSRLRDFWDALPRDTRITTLAASAHSGLLPLLQETVVSLQADLTQLTMPVEQTYETLLQFQEAYKDARREIEVLEDLITMIQITRKALAEAAE